MSRAEEITSEVRKLVLTCRSLEAQLQQSVPKKTYEETITKMQTAIDSLNAELSRARSELENTTSLGQRISTLEAQIGSQSEIISSQGHTFEAISSKLVENSVPFALYTENLAKVQALEARISSLVDPNEYNAVKQNCSELQVQIANMVSKSTFENLQEQLTNSVPVQKYEELKISFEQMVPREQFNVAEARVAELESALANSVPRHDFEELAGRIAKITEEAAQLASQAQAAVAPVTVSDSPTPESAPVAVSPEPAPQAEVAKTAPVEVAPIPVADVTPSIIIAEPNSAPAPIPVEEIQAQIQTVAPPVEVQAPESVTPTAVNEPSPSISISEPVVASAPAPVEVLTQVPNQDVVAPVQSPAPATQPPEEVIPTPAVVETSNSPETIALESQIPEANPTPVQTEVQIVEAIVAAPAPSETPTAPAEPAPTVEPQPQEIAEVQSHLSEITSAIETGVTTLSPTVQQVPVAMQVESEKGFRFSNTEFCAKSGMEFLEDIEKVDISVIFAHTQSGDFERWFKEVLADESSAQSVRSIRESNVSGEDLRTMLVAAIAPRYRA